MLGREGGLRIFEAFWVDSDLPKHRNREDGDTVDWDDVGPTRRQGRPRLQLSSNGAMVTFDGIDRPHGWIARLFRWIGSWFARAPKMLPGRSMTVPEFFAAIKGSADAVPVVEARARGYEKALADAEALGQTARAEQLKAGLVAQRAQAHMVTIGVTRMVAEAAVVEFYKKSPKGLRLDWLKNFTRNVPADIAARKLRADELGLFDNYAVLHYDPDTKSYAETEAQKAARRDPILFGLIEGRTDLYVVGDWVDEVCDLTLDQFADLVGHGKIGEV